MKNYRQLIKELPSKTVVFAFGRFNPPTIGHELLVRAVRKLAQQRKADHVIYASASHDAKKNPLDVTKKIGYLRLMFPNTNFVGAGGDERTFIEAAKALNKRYKNLIMIAGSDRVPAFTKLLNDYNGKEYHYDTIEVVSAGERDPDADDATGMSASKMRALAVKGDYLQFKRGLPTTIRDIDGRRLMNDIRHGMGLEVVKEQLNLVKDDLREQYFRGEVFNLGDIVESGDSVFKIVKRGSNHLLLQDSTGKLVSKWIQDVTQTEKEFMVNEDLTDKTLKVNTDKIKVARIIATMLGIDNAETMANPEVLVNTALRKARQKALNPEALKIVAKMLTLADEVGIKYDATLKPQKLKETITQAVTIQDPNPKKKKKDIQEDINQGAASARTAARQSKLADLQAKQAKEKEDMMKRQKKDTEQLRNNLRVHESHHAIMGYNAYSKSIKDMTAPRLPSRKDTESDHDATVGDESPTHGHVGQLGHSPAHDDNLRRRKVKYHLGESHVEFRIDHREKVTGNTKTTFADHEAKVSDQSDKATYVKVPKHKADSFKSAMKSKHGTTVELAEETEEQSDEHTKQLKRFKDQAKETKLTESFEEAEKHKSNADKAKAKGDLGAYHAHMSQHHESMGQWHESKGRNSSADREYAKAEHHHEESLKHPYKEEYCADEYASGEIDINSGDIHNEMTDDEIEHLIDGLSDEDYLEAYEDDELAIIDAESGEQVAETEDEKGMNEGVILEVLSRMERMRAKIRIRKTQAKRERAEKIAIKRYSDVKTINKRSRRLAIRLMKKRMLRGRDINKISVPEKERMERMIARRKAVIGRIALRLAPRVRKIEKNRLSHSKFTTGSTPNVF